MILVTGSSGFIGQNLINRLHSLCLKYEEVDFKLGIDLCHFTWPPRHYSKIIHLAACTDVRYSISNSIQTLTNNIRSTINILEFTKACGSHLIFASSMNALDSTSPYLASKSACEAICTAYRQSYNIPVTTLRLSNVYGPCSAHKTSVIPTFIKNALNNKPLEINGSGLQTRDFIYVDDVVDTILNAHPTDTLTKVASGSTSTILDIAEIIQLLSSKHLGYVPRVELLDFIPGEISKVTPSTSITPSTTLKEGLSKTFNWFKENYK